MCERPVASVNSIQFTLESKYNAVMRKSLVIWLILAGPWLCAQPLNRAQMEANLEHMKNFSAYFQLKKFPEAVAEAEKMNGRPEMPMHLLPDLAVAYDQVDKPKAAIAALQRVRAKHKETAHSGGLLLVVTKLQDTRAKIKDANVKAEMTKLLKELPAREKLLEETLAKARQNSAPRPSSK